MANPTIDGLAELGADAAERVQGGAVAPLVAVLLVGSAAFAVDLGYVAVTGSELQNEADTASYFAVSGAGSRR